MSFAGLQAAWARILLGGLADAGVRDVAVSPGSRSTPFTMAALEEPRLRCHSIIDERSAAFFALGCARATGVPSLVIATSGTAGAHHLPAVIEAGMSSLPLLVLTADRPFELQGCGALQTIDQLKMFGDHARAFFDIPIGDPTLEGQRRLRALAAQAVLHATHPRAGAVHLNARARKPLEPPFDQGALRLDEAAQTVYVAPQRLPPDQVARAIADRLRSARRGVIVVGPLPAFDHEATESILELAMTARVPIIADATSQLLFAPARLREGRVITSPTPLLDSSEVRRRLRPDLILQLGPIPTSSAGQAYLADHRDAARVVIAASAECDPESSASMALIADLAPSARMIARASLSGPRPPESALAREIAEERERMSPAVDEALVLCRGAVIREALRATPRRSLVLTSNGLAIRDLDRFAPQGVCEVRVLCQRGASGIDGMVSGAAGASAASGAPLTALIGDVAFLHDLGGLMIARRARTPLVLVVLNDDGGRIFEQLPLARESRADLSFWITPHGLEMRGACEMFGVDYARVESADDVPGAIRAAHARAWCTVIEVKLRRADA
jgi:2-succinyl-5-enolpyruvyl-6-hydroxy-3-cyclohexene-1-carboxylate synthase